MAEYSDGSDAKVIGYARSILRERVRELTELFVHPDCQSAGVGRELLQRAFPADNTRHRVIIATPDTPALARYLKCGVAPYFPTATFSRAPRRLDLAPGLEVTRMPGGLPTGPLQNRSRLRGTGPLRPPNNAVLPPTLATPTQSILSTIDQQVLGHTRPVDHTWLMGQMDGYIYRWHSQVIGYGYVGADGGPFALMYPANYPAVLAHAEREAALRNFPQFYLEVPLINRSAVDWLLSNGYTMSNFLALFMSETHWGCFENYIFPSPPFFL